MRKTTTPPKIRLANNLRRLMDMQAEGAYKVADIAAVVPKTVYNLLAAKHDPRLTSVEKAARVFGLEAWQLLVPDLERKPADDGDVLALLEHFLDADESGRETIMQVAKIAAKKLAE